MEIMEDLKIINKVSGKPIHRKPNQTPTMHLELPTEARIDDGRLYYDKRWYVMVHVLTEYPIGASVVHVSVSAVQVGTHGKYYPLLQISFIHLFDWLFLQYP